MHHHDTTPTAVRFDLYGPIHKALRAWLFDTVVRVGRLDLDDTGELRRVCDQVDTLAATLRSHLAHEDAFIHGLMQSLAAGSPQQAADDHADHLEAIARTEALNAVLRAAPSRAACEALYHHLALVTAENIEHMHLEETRHHAVLWEHCTDAELLAVEQAIVASLPPREFTDMLSWMLPALAPAVRTQMLTGIRQDAPPPVFEMVLGIARSNLDATGWAKLARSLGVPMVPGLAMA